jgi:hypothetical protein
MKINATAIILLVIGFVPSAFSCIPTIVGIHVGEIRTTMDKDILQARIDGNPYIPMWPSPPGVGLPNSAFATIDLVTGRLSPGSPSATLVPMPQENWDPTAGYSVEIGRVNVGLIDSGGSIVASFESFPYVNDYDYRDTFFVSEKLQRGYVFFEERGCTDEHEVAVAIIDLSTSSTSLFTTTVFDYLLPWGFDCHVTGRRNFETIYDNIQVVALPGPNCVDNTYVFFNETSVYFTTQKMWVESWDMLDAIVYGENANENRAFLVQHDYNWWDSCYDEYYYCPESYSVQEIIISTGEILRTIDLNRQDVVSIIYNNYTSKPELTIPPTPEPTTPTLEPTPELSGTTDLLTGNRYLPIALSLLWPFPFPSA